MKNKAKMTVRLGDLIAALYDEAEKETKVKNLQTGIVALALLDLSKKTLKSRRTAYKYKKVA